MATGCYLVGAMTIKTVGIKKLKDNLSAYLKEARAGTVILITDRDRVIAELHEPIMDIHPHVHRTLISEWAREGKLVPPLNKKTACPASPLRLDRVISSHLLDQERGE